MTTRTTYPSYKPSGIDWLGDIPSHWDTTKAGAVTELMNGYPYESSSFSKTDGIPLIRIRDIYRSKTEVGYTGTEGLNHLIQPGDLVIGMDGDFNVARWSGSEALLNQRLCSLAPKSEIDARYLYYSIRFPLNQINEMTYATTVKHLSSNQVRRIPLALPPLDEQRAIADYLDRKDAEITRFIESRRRMIALLEEKKQAIINQAVTRGLDPTVPMKDSGVEWLGEVPAHWVLVPLKSLANRWIIGSTPESNNESYYTDGSVPWYGPSSIQNSIEVGDPVKNLPRLAFEQGGARLIEPPALLVVVIGATRGKSALLLEKGSTNQQLLSFELKTTASPAFVAEQFRLSRGFIAASASTATMPIVRTGAVASIPIAVPPLDEQRKIIEHLSHDGELILRQQSQMEREINLLQEYRTRLISDVVTGKVRVG